MKGLLTFLALLCICVSLQAQVSGVVKDKKTGRTLEGVEVFINNSSWRTITNEDGTFLLEGIYPGFVDLVLYKKGYTIFKSSIRIQEEKLYKLNLTLAADEKPKTTKIKKDALWNSNFQWFQQGLIGSSTAADCKIENIQSLQFERHNNILYAMSDDPLRVENERLGFVMNVYLQQFEAGTSTSKFLALVSYQIKSSEDYNQQSEWERNRLKAYWGSPRHLFQTWTAGISAQEGFTFLDASGNQQNATLMVSKGSFPGYYKINLTDSLQVHYKMESSRTGIIDNTSGQASWIIPRESIEVNELGVVFNPKSVEFKGNMAENGISEYLPIDYLPTSSIENEKMDWRNFAMLREKVYLHTDRDYYYPRESIWFKAYLGYSLPLLRDTLSRTLYVELISPSKKTLDTKVYRINEGVTWGDFKLPDSLPTGQYFLRAYTNWMRNYGDSALYVKTIPVLSWNQNIEPTLQEAAIQSPRITIDPDKESYAARQLVTLNLRMVDEQGNPVKGNLSVSVTDAVSAVPLNHPGITDSSSLTIYDFGENNRYFDQITYYMERGISFRGVVKDAKGNPTACGMEIVQGNMDNLISMETDEHGEFLVTGVNYMDSLVFAFKPMNKKGKTLDRVELIPRDIPPFNMNVKPMVLQYKKEDALQRIQNSYRPDEKTIMLNEVEVKSTSLAANAPGNNLRIYGTPDYVVKGENIVATSAGTNFLVGLQGKVPGLQVTEMRDPGGLPIIRVKIRGGTSSLAANTDPLILVDGVPFPDAQSISALNPAIVDRVEVITRASPQYGSRGSNGLIAIYTKSGYNLDGTKNYLSHKIKGYDRPQVFYSPDYSKEKEGDNPDFRTTIFWKPDVRTDEKGIASVIFYTADLATRYRIVVEGITEQGKPVRAVSYVTVE
jgi:hypothetical protein